MAQFIYHFALFPCFASVDIKITLPIFYFVLRKPYTDFGVRFQNPFMISPLNHIAMYFCSFILLQVFLLQ